MPHGESQTVREAVTKPLSDGFAKGALRSSLDVVDTPWPDPILSKNKLLYMLHLLRNITRSQTFPVVLSTDADVAIN